MKIKFKQNPRSFYNFVNSKRRSQEFPSSMKLDDIESDDDTVISNMFADFFATTYSNSQYCNNEKYPFNITGNQFISFPLLDNCDVLRGLKLLKSSTCPGPDGISSIFLINCAEILSQVFTYVFNTSLKSGYFPKMWKESYIIPLFKSGNKGNISNYRGIAKLNVIPKLFEKLITDYLVHHTSSILSPYQHGFRKKCSTVTNLLHFTTIVNKGFINGEQTDAIYTDFSKAFDKVNIDLLLVKLNLLGFSVIALKWISSYLKDRKQRVRYKNRISKCISVPSGVPQGSHLGPILFSLFINDLPSVIHYSNILLYADDVKIFFSYKDSSSVNLFKNDLNNFHQWCNINLMELNLLKCKCMRFSRKNLFIISYYLGGHQLTVVDSFMDLGVLLDTKLTFVPHIYMTVNKARGVLGFIKRWAKEFSDPYITKRLYISLVRPILEYGSVVWDPYYTIHIDHIESVQKRFLIFCLRGLPWDPSINLPSYRSRLMLIRLPTLKSRRTMLNISFLLNLLNGDISSEFLLYNISFNIPQRTVRSYRPLFLEVFRRNYADADPVRRLCRQFNELYEIVDFSVSTNIIKNNIISLLNL